jgi:replicative DNA helicase
MVIGAILTDSNAYNEVAAILTSECFYVPSHELIYRACVSLNAKGMPIDVLTVNEELTRNGNVDKSGGIQYLNELTNSIGSSANISTHAKIIYQKYMMREAIRLSAEIIENAYNDTTDPFALIDKAQIQFAKIVEKIKIVLHIKKVSLKKLRRPKVKALLQEKEEEIALLIT